MSAVDLFDSELAAWHEAGLSPTLWWRDDDAVSCSPALEKLTGICENNQIPVMLAVVPSGVTAKLADYLAFHPILQTVTHGYAHHNHAEVDHKKTELTENGSGRSVDDVLEELHNARQIMASLFGNSAGQVLVPPWNRLSDNVAKQLATTGFRLISTFGEQKAGTALRQVNCHIDLMDWKPLRQGKKFERVIDELCTCLSARRQSPAPDAPIGILSHHLVHDDDAWETTEKLMALIGGRRFITAISRDDLLAQAIG